MENLAKYHRGLSRRAKDILFKTVMYLIAAVACFSFILPFFWMLSTSLKEITEIQTIPVTWIPRNPTLENYKSVFAVSAYVNIPIGFLNTVLIAVPTVFVGVFISSLAAFAYAKIPFPGRDKIFFVFVATMALPGVITMIPKYILYTKLNWINTWLPLMIPGMFGSAGTVFFTRQFMKGIPSSLEEAAKLDGLNWFGIFIRIELPLCKAVLATNIMFGLIGKYNDYIGPMLYLGGDTRLWTLQQMVALLNDSSSTGKDTGVYMAGAMIAVLPMIILFIALQRYFVEGIAISGIKG